MRFKFNYTTKKIKIDPRTFSTNAINPQFVGGFKVKSLN